MENSYIDFFPIEEYTKNALFSEFSPHCAFLQFYICERASNNISAIKSPVRNQYVGQKLIFWSTNTTIHTTEHTHQQPLCIDMVKTSWAYESVSKREKGLLSYGITVEFFLLKWFEFFTTFLLYSFVPL